MIGGVSTASARHAGTWLSECQSALAHIRAPSVMADARESGGPLRVGAISRGARGRRAVDATDDSGGGGAQLVEIA